MEYRSLGRTGVQVSALCLGGMNFGGRADSPTSIRLMLGQADLHEYVGDIEEEARYRPETPQVSL